MSRWIAAAITVGRAETAELESYLLSIFPITGRLKALQRSSGSVPSQGGFLGHDLTASKNVTFRR